VDSLVANRPIRLVARVPDAPVEVVTDSQRLRQIAINLLSNAIKFTEEGTVELAVVADERWVELRVTDTGIGIPPSALPDLFQAFHQLDVGDGRRFEGTGMGLALSRRLARALGGDIDVTSRSGEGSTFRVRLPRAGQRFAVDARATTDEANA
jgi:signal transduction histidine kinase